MRDTNGVAPAIPKMVLRVLSSKACHGKLVESPRKSSCFGSRFDPELPPFLLSRPLLMNGEIFSDSEARAGNVGNVGRGSVWYSNVISMFLGAIKFGEPLAVDECQQLIRELSTCDLPFQCAHGRYSFPISFFISPSFHFPLFFFFLIFFSRQFFTRSIHVICFSHIK